MKKQTVIVIAVAVLFVFSVFGAVMAASQDYGFEKGTDGWSPSVKTVKITQAKDKKHKGSASLKISGVAGDSVWNFGFSPKFNLEAGKKYKLSAFMLVGSWSKSKFPPLLKCGIYQNGKFSANAFSSKYNMKKIKEWQPLSAQFTAPADGSISALVSLEKGTQEPIDATVYLDEIKVERIQ